MKKEALIVIDMQNGFIEEASPLCIRHAKETVPACAKTINAARSAGMVIIFVNRIYREDGSDVEKTRYEKWSAGGKPLTRSAQGDLSAENPKEFNKCESDYEIIKQRFSAFFQTELDMLLRRLGITKIYLAGTTTPNCIRTTCYDGLSLDYDVTIIEDCCSSNTYEIQASNCIDMLNVGAEVVMSREFIEGLGE